MTAYSIGKFNEAAQRNLIRWVEDNPKLKNKITPHDLKYLFEFHNRRGLSIDLCRFDIDYYNEVFFPPEGNKPLTDHFVGIVCNILRHTLTSMGKEKLHITVTVRHKALRVSHWQTFYMDEDYKPKWKPDLSRKDFDWL
ncbi:hypothetical protein AAFN85_13715 [Mucilaginibacter sp. CAU 1740]|uniref:hypothetical protein n=1 Tax=Mucilaginibacter sp. CAU 1740 TaxID=3140365 RepID=UPI00325A8226